MFRRRVVDGRGRLRVVPPPDPGHGTVQRGPEAEELNLMRAEIYGVPSGFMTRLAAGAITVSLLGGLLYWRAAAMMDPADRPGAATVALLVGAAAAWGVFRLGVRPADYRAAGERLMRCRLCICCGYDLRGVRPEGDGMTVCPECGAAWELPTAVAGRGSGSPN